MDLDLISERFEKLVFSLPRLQFDTGDNDTIILNDSYSSSRKGFILAVNEATKKKTSNSKLIVITKGTLELGGEKKKIYAELAYECAGKIDILITTDTTLSKAFKASNSNLVIENARSLDKILMSTRNYIQPGDVVLIEGRVEPQILKELVSDKA